MVTDTSAMEMEMTVHLKAMDTEDTPGKSKSKGKDITEKGASTEAKAKVKEVLTAKDIRMEAKEKEKEDRMAKEKEDRMAKEK